MAEIFHQRKSLFSLFIMSAVLIVAGCDEDDNTPNIMENDVIGTWVLTKIIVTYPLGAIEIYPQEENSTAIIILNSDKTYQRDQNIQGQVANDSGSWSVANGTLIIVSDSVTYNFPCHINGNKLQIATTRTDPDSGTILPITLEFTRQ